jgi:hypothetical protein
MKYNQVNRGPLFATLKKLGSIKIKTVKPETTFCKLTDQCPGIHPPYGKAYNRMSTGFTPPTNYIKENRFAIITIMLKQMAAELREKYPHLLIKAHPMNYEIGRARLVVRNGETRVIFDITPKQHDWRNPQVRKDPNEYSVSLQITDGNTIAKKKTPSSWSFHLDDPTSTTKFEEWTYSVIAKYVIEKAPEKSEA